MLETRQPVRLARGVLRDHREHHFAMIEVFEPFLARNDFALRWKDGRDAHQVLRGDARIPKGQLKRGQTLLVFAYALGEEELLRDHVFSQFRCILRQSCTRLNLQGSRMSLSQIDGCQGREDCDFNPEFMRAEPRAIPKLPPN